MVEIGLLTTALLVIGAIIALFALSWAIVINQEYERAVVFRLGSYSRVLGPGFKLIIPFLEWYQKVDYRIRSVNVQPQKVLTKDNVTVSVDAIVFYQVKREKEELKKSVLEVEDFAEVTVDYGQSMLRDIIGKNELDVILQERDEIADTLRDKLDEETNPFGVSVDNVEIKDVSIPDNMERAMAAEAEAERERRARITNAQGELQAAVRTRLASDVLGEEGYQLRTLQTIDSVGQESNTIALFPASLTPGMTGEGETLFTDFVGQLRDELDLTEILDNVGDVDNVVEQIGEEGA